MNSLAEARPSVVPAPVSGSPAPQCAFTVDVEDWYQSSVDFNAPISDRVVRNVEGLAELLREYGIRGTFFVQGLVAKKFPKLLQNLLAEGHEIQSHGHTHRPLFSMNPRELGCELDQARKSVEDACGVRVTSFRAPDFSILHGNLWALGALAENGFTIDSSVFPMRTRRYGIAGWENRPLRIRLSSGASILEVPVAVWKRGRWALPVAGGGYFRLLPRLLLRQAIGDMLRRKQRVVIYCHPYEFSCGELSDYINNVSWPVRFSQGMGRNSVPAKMAYLFRCFRFGRFDELVGEESANLCLRKT